MAAGVQMHEHLGLLHRSGRNNLVHLLGRGHLRRILQDVEGAPAQRLESALREDLREHVVGVGEVGREEGGERSKPLIHRLAHVAKCGLGPFRKSSGSRVHQDMLQRFLDRHGSLSFRLVDEGGDRHALERNLLHVQLEGFEVFVRRLGDDLHVLTERLAGLRPKSLRAL